MNGFRDLEELIYRFSTALLYPTLALLLWYALRVIVHLGEAFRDFVTLRPGRWGGAGRRLRDLGADDAGSISAKLKSVAGDRGRHALVRSFARELGREFERGDRRTLPARVRHLAGQFESELARDVDRVRVLVRVGPCLGLAATLIPLGPGLAALGRGDLEQLSSQLIVAFSATVVGLVIGGAGYVLAIARAHTSDRAASDIELLGDLAIASVPEWGPEREAGPAAVAAPAFLPANGEEAP